MHDRLPLRDELFLLAHDDENGFSPRINIPALGIGLAGATLIDLLIDGWIRVDRGALRARTSGVHARTRTGHRLADAALRAIAAAPGVMAREVIQHDAPTLYQQTLTALVNSGVLVHSRRRLRRDRYEAADPAVIVRTRAEPRSAIYHPTHVDLRTDALCALIRATGVEDALYVNASTTAIREQLDAITNRIRSLARDPYLVAIPDITAAVEAAIGDLAVAVYR